MEENICTPIRLISGSIYEGLPTFEAQLEISIILNFVFLESINTSPHIMLEMSNIQKHPLERYIDFPMLLRGRKGCLATAKEKHIIALADGNF